MTTILDQIIKEKAKEVETLLNQTFEQIDIRQPKKTFKQMIEQRNTIGVIAEIKRSSPSKGAINETVDPVKQAITYATNGASAISVLTDYPFFKGTIDDLKAVREVVDIPILCKDFIIHKVQIDRAKAAGANIILLIAAALDDHTFKELYEYAKEQQLEVLCEVHDEEEMEKVLNLQPEIIGINNRDLKTFEVNLDNTARLAKMVDENTILISESGIQSKADVETVALAGANAILVGETLMRASNVKQTLADFQIPLANKAR